MIVRRWSIRLSLVAVSLLLCCVGLEIGLRLFSPIAPSGAAINAEHPVLPSSVVTTRPT